MSAKRGRTSGRVTPARRATGGTAALAKARPTSAGASPRTTEPLVDTGQGRAIMRSSWAGSATFVVGSATAAAVKGARLPAAIVDLGLFFGGCGVFLAALAAAAARSREREIGLWSLFLLEGVAPRSVRRVLLGSLALEVTVALGTAWISVALAFGCLVPLWALGHCGLWGARYGAFAPRAPAVGCNGRKAKG